MFWTKIPTYCTFTYYSCCYAVPFHLSQTLVLRVLLHWQHLSYNFQLKLGGSKPQGEKKSHLEPTLSLWCEASARPLLPRNNPKTHFRQISFFTLHSSFCLWSAEVSGWYAQFGWTQKTDQKPITCNFPLKYILKLRINSNQNSKTGPNYMKLHKLINKLGIR